MKFVPVTEAGYRIIMPYGFFVNYVLASLLMSSFRASWLFTYNIGPAHASTSTIEVTVGIAFNVPCYNEQEVEYIRL
jgi:hypothetical protein